MTSIPSFRTLPPEIWLIIFDLAVDASIIPDEICSYSNLARLIEYIRAPSMHVPIDRSWANLRLVSQEFKTLVGPAIRFHTNRQDVLQGARDVYIHPPSCVTSCLEQIARHPHNNKIVALTVKYGDSQDEQERVGRSILQYGPSLFNLRKLTITLNRVDQSTVWRNLNDAFPFLTCLVIYGYCTPSYAVSFEVGTVVFQHLKILELDCFLPYIGVEFPALRHVSLSRCSQEEMVVLARWPQLESLLLRTMHRHARFNWNHFPNLRLLGIPPTHMWIVSRCPYDHPLSHLSLYVSTGGSSPFLVEPIMERFFSTTKIILNLGSISERRLDDIARGCASCGVELIGSPYSLTRRSALFIAGMVPPAVTDTINSTAITAAEMLAMPLVAIVCWLCGGPYD